MVVGEERRALFSFWELTPGGEGKVESTCRPTVEGSSYTGPGEAERGTWPRWLLPKTVCAREGERGGAGRSARPKTQYELKRVEGLQRASGGTAKDAAPGFKGSSTASTFGPRARPAARRAAGGVSERRTPPQKLSRAHASCSELSSRRATHLRHARLGGEEHPSRLAVPEADGKPADEWGTGLARDWARPRGSKGPAKEVEEK